LCKTIKELLAQAKSASFVAQKFRSFFAETIWSMRHFGHLSHTCVKTSRNSAH